MYIEEGYKQWAQTVVNLCNAKELRKVQAWWFGMPVKFGEDVVASKKGEAFDIYGKDVALKHGKALKELMSVG